MSHRPLSVSSPHLERASVLLQSAAVAVGTLVLALSAHVAVPFWPVPITLQSLAVLLIGLVLGPWLAAATVAAYVAEGMIGLPVFANAGGLTALSGPTFGYIAGFLPAVVLVGLAGERGLLRRATWTLAAFAAADALIFAVGLAWLSTSFGWSRAVAVGLAPFLLGEAIKIALATAIAQVWVGRLKRGA